MPRRPESFTEPTTVHAEVFGEPTEGFKTLIALIEACEDEGSIDKAKANLAQAREIVVTLENPERELALAKLEDMEKRLQA